MSEDPSRNAIDNSIDWVFRAAELVDEYYEGEEKETGKKDLEKTLQDLCKSDMEYSLSLRILSKLEEEDNENELLEFADIQAALTESLEKNHKNINFKKHPRYIEFTNQSKEQGNDGDEELVCTDAAINIIDPYTKAFIMHPVKNRICGHHYDKPPVMELLKKKKSLKCPYAGCVSKKFEASDLVEDKKLSQKIQQRVAASQQLNETASTSTSMM